MCKKLFFKFVNRETILYVTFGLITTVVSIVSYIVAVTLLSGGEEASEFQINIANIISWVLAVSFAYITNKIWVFKSNAMEFKELLREISSFIGARIVSLIVEIIWMNGFIWLLGVQYDKLYKVGAQFGIVIMNYVFSKFFIFKMAEKHNF